MVAEYKARKGRETHLASVQWDAPPAPKEVPVILPPPPPLPMAAPTSVPMEIAPVVHSDAGVSMEVEHLVPPNAQSVGTLDDPIFTEELCNTPATHGPAAVILAAL